MHYAGWVHPRPAEPALFPCAPCHVAPGKDEEEFLEALWRAGFAVEEVPAEQVGEEYREEMGGTYRLVRAARLG